jgi:hypothetical protein
MIKILFLVVLTALLVVLAIVAFAVAVPVFVRAWDSTFRDQRRSSGGSSGVLGAMSEIDRFVRPAVEHVTEVQDAARLKQDEVSGE